MVNSFRYSIHVFTSKKNAEVKDLKHEIDVTSKPKDFENMLKNAKKTLNILAEK